ncbi:methyltransferase domain-containing protein [Pseudomonas putida]|uniref:methyltransferase domain-containing protein n=1 Tax=Pseudomonas putida TaxID=303 RepID=UPI003D99ECE6
MSQDIRLYQSAQIWDQPMQIGQRNLLAALLDFWPRSVASALDVGCGDGKLSAIIAQTTGTHFTGLDSSAEALSRLPYPGVLGDATSLPFEDGAFDSVITTDALEHMPDHEEQIAWSELFRVARNWVMVAVPFREEMLDATSICNSCGHAYHVNWHQRAYDIADLHRKAPLGWHVTASVISGEPWTQMLPLETRFRHEHLGEAAGWESAICPHCGAGGHCGTSPTPLASLNAAALGQAVYEDLRIGRYWRSHSEVLVVFSRQKDFHVQVPLALAQGMSATEFQPSNPPVLDLLPYPQVSQYVVVDDLWRVQLPLYADQSRLHVRRVPGSTEPLTLRVEDAFGVLFDALALEADQNEATLEFGRVIVPGYYGVLVTLKAGSPLLSLSLEKGPQILRLSRPDDAKVGYFIDRYAGVPLYIQVVEPLWLDPEMYDAWRVPGELAIASVLDQMEIQFTALKESLALASQSAGLASAQKLEEKVERFAIAIQNLEQERDALLIRAREADSQSVQLQNLKAERDALLAKARASDVQAVELQNLSVERDALLAKARIADAQAVELQNLSAERDALLAKARTADAQAVELQNLSAERDALLAKARTADAQAVELQNLSAERDALLAKARKADAQAVELQNLSAERDALLAKARTADAQAVELQNLSAERDALLAKAHTADTQAVELQNLSAERDTLQAKARTADAQAVELQNLSAERDTLQAKARTADAQAVELQNLSAERDTLQARARTADAQAVELQNLSAERDALLVKTRATDALAVALQNLTAERDTLLSRAEEANRLAVDLQNVTAERDALMRIASDANRIEVQNQNLTYELQILRRRAEECEVLEVKLQNLEASHEELLVKALNADRLAVVIQEVEEQNEIQRMHLREAGEQAVALQALVAKHQQILEELEHTKERAQQSDKLAEERDALTQRYHQLEAEAAEQMAQLNNLNMNIENRLGSFARRHLGKIRHRVSTGEN